MELHAFGFNGHSQFAAQPEIKALLTQENIVSSRQTYNGQTIQILWSSWCDSLIALRSSSSGDNTTQILYNGVGLSEEQVNHIQNNAESVHGFFGAPLSDGLGGMLEKGNPSRVTFFQIAESSTPSIETYNEPEDVIVQHISITSGGNVSVAATRKTNRVGSDTIDQSFILQFDSLRDFKLWLQTSQSLDSSKVLPFTQCKQLVSNATTTTALTSSGQVYTWTRDPRFPRCLGRPSDDEMPPHEPSQIPYLSETKIVRVASGGYMTAAISDDGELFLWGQACPGTEGELEVLSSNEAMENGVEEQDEFVKCVPLIFEGREARAEDAAIGSGHVLVAVDFHLQSDDLDPTSDTSTSKAVYAMGQGESGQLGLESTLTFQNQLIESESLRNKSVTSMAAAGWTSWIVVES